MTEKKTNQQNTAQNILEGYFRLADFKKVFAFIHPVA
jgi:hypothetical protein